MGNSGSKYSFKVVLIGDDSVGKSCLVQRFTQGAFPNPLPSSTLGAGFSDKTVKVDDVEIKLQIWDTPGQKRYPPMSRNVYRSANAVVLLYDITRQPSFDCLPEWVEEIKQNADGKVLKVLVGTKIDQKDERIIPKSVGQKFADSNGFDYFVEVSAQDGSNVDALFQEVATRLTSIYKVKTVTDTGSKYLSKLVMIGYTGVGKSCLSWRFTQGTFERQNNTVGAEIWQKAVKVDDDKISFQIWNTCGVERFRPIRQIYYRSAHAVVLLYDITFQPSFDSLPEWVEEIEQYADGKVLKVLVGTKIDRKDERIIPKTVGQNFADSNGFDYFVEVSALDGTNVDALFQEVATRLKMVMNLWDDK